MNFGSGTCAGASDLSTGDYLIHKTCRACSTSFFVFFYREKAFVVFLTTVDNIFLAIVFRKKYDGIDNRVL